MKNKLRSGFFFIAFYFFLLFLLTACSGNAARAWLKAPGWSHGLPLEETQTSDPATVALDDSGNIYLFLVTAVNDVRRPKVIALNRQTDIIWEQTLAFDMVRPDQQEIVWDGQSLNLFWLANNSLYRAQIDVSGHMTLEPVKLSGNNVVDAYDVALSNDGSLTIWYAGKRREPGLYALDGDLTGEAKLIDADGIRPTLQYDDSGTLHAAWAHYPPGFENTFFFYGTYQDGVYKSEQDTVIYQPFLSTTDILVGPWLGLDMDEAYLIWNISVRTGPEAGKILTEYLHFPKGEPTTTAVPQIIAVPSIFELEYTHEPEDGLAAGSRVFPVDGVYPITPAVTGVTLNETAVPQQELALTFNVQVLHEFRKVRSQIGTLFLKDGNPTGYQLLSFTPEASIAPTIISDEDKNLYLTWLERGEIDGFTIYFSSTAPDIKKALSGVTWGDITQITRETVFGLLSGAVLAPIVVLLWLMVPLLVLSLTSFLRRKDDSRLTDLGTITSLLMAWAVYWGGKLFTIPGIRSYVPFSAWIPAIPTWLQAPLQIIVPIVITLIAVAVAWNFTYRRKSTSLLYFASLFAALDGLLTMAVYGFQFYNLI